MKEDGHLSLDSVALVAGSTFLEMMLDLVALFLRQSLPVEVQERKLQRLSAILFHPRFPGSSLAMCLPRRRVQYALT
jgi:hypothetical protein